MENPIIIAIIIILLPAIYFFGGLLLKILWGWWPVPTSISSGIYIVYENGMDYFVFIPVGMLGAIVITWLWQRSKYFLKGDKLIGKLTFFN